MISTLSPDATGPSLDLCQMSSEDMEEYRERIENITPVYGAFLFGYPHLLPQMQGEALSKWFLIACLGCHFYLRLRRLVLTLNDYALFR